MTGLHDGDLLHAEGMTRFLSLEKLGKARLRGPGMLNMDVNMDLQRDVEHS